MKKHMLAWSETVFGDPLSIDGGRLSLWGRYGNRWFKVNMNETKVPDGYPITPNHLEPPKSDQLGKFGRMEIETLASSLVTFAQQRGHWGDFTFDEMAEARGHRNFVFTGLLELGFILDNEDSTYSFTMGFVNELYGEVAYWDQRLQKAR